MTAPIDPGLIDVEQARAELARRHILHFTRHTFPGYMVNWHHRLICDYLQAFVEGKIKRLMINVGPQTGKSELASRRLPAYMLGLNPDLKVAACSYNSDKAREFNLHVQRIITGQKYKSVFPNTRLSERHLSADNNGGWLRNSDVFEIVGRKGSFTSAGIGSALTGKTVDILIVDDIVKDMVEGKSPTTQKRNIEWWDSVAKTRLHNDSQILFLMTRWDINDLPGVIQRRILTGKEKPFVIIKLPSIKMADIIDGDPRQEGEALWPEKHSIESLLIEQKANPSIFKAMHQQDPTVSDEYLIFPNWVQIEKMPGLDSFYGIDFGFSNNPTAAVECQFEKSPIRDKAYLRELFYARGMSTQAIADRLRPIVGQKKVYCDRADARMIMELGQLGIRTDKSISGKNSVLAHILFMQSLDVYYTSDSKNIELEQRNYQWAPDQNGPTNTEIDKYNHLIKAAMYALYKKIKFEPKLIMGYA